MSSPFTNDQSIENETILKEQLSSSLKKKKDKNSVSQEQFNSSGQVSHILF